MKNFPKTLGPAGQMRSYLDQSRILVVFKNSTKLTDVIQRAKAVKLVAETYQPKDNMPWVSVNHTDQRFWLKTHDGETISEETFSTIEKHFGEALDWIGPVYRKGKEDGPSNLYCPVPFVALIPKGKVNDAGKFAEEHGLSLHQEKSKYLSQYYYFELNRDIGINVFALQAKLAKSNIDVVFENMPAMRPLLAVPNDPMWPNQWDMVQINASDGWDITTGNQCVIISILDGGCDLTHPDLLPRYAEPGINLGTMLPDGSPTHPHGTPCAGIAAATLDNGEGIAGVAGSCRIMPLAFQNWTDVECANGINYSVSSPYRKADVISMSFGVYGPGEGPTFGWNMAVIEPEIQNAFVNDLVMCAATGNEDRNDFNRFPGRHPHVIAVGASSTDDDRKSPASPDGEFWWGSNYGQDIYNGTTTGVSVVAPGVLCPTTDIQGASGYSNNDYLPNFNGTSAATPHVAGLAGLIKSKYPTLSNLQIREAIEKSADKVGPTPYGFQAGFPNGSRNQQMGYGRINVLNALKTARNMTTCKDIKIIANRDLHGQASNKYNHLQSGQDCRDFKGYDPCSNRQEECQPVRIPEISPCFYLHWGDGKNDIIETDDYEVLILSVCNPYENAAFKNLKLTNIEVLKPDGTPVEILPDGTASASIVPSKLITFCEVESCTCCHTELVLRTCGAKEGRYLIKLEYCIDEICIHQSGRLTGKQVASFDIELLKS